MLEAIALRCERSDRVLFDALSFTAKPRTLLHIAGANGSGKTSLLRIICGLLAPAEGHLCWRGNAVKDQRERYASELVYVGHLNGVKDDLSARENLHFSAALSGRSTTSTSIDAALASVGMAGFESRLARHLSQGQRRRVALARLFFSEAASLWILDEPFTALDVQGVSAVNALIGQHLQRGGIVILTTHQDLAIAAAQVHTIDLDAMKSIVC